MGNAKKYIFVLTGKSGAGKDSLANSFVRMTEGLEVGVATTSRDKRSGEEEGIDYFFISHEEFLEKIRASEFWEYDFFPKIMDGELKEAGYGFEKDRNKFLEHNYIVTADYERFKKMQEMFGDSVIGIYITVSDIAREQRARERDANFDYSEWERRLALEKNMYDDNLDEFDFIITNTYFPRALETLTEIYKIYTS